MTTIRSGDRQPARIARIAWGAVFYGLVWPFGVASRALRFGRYEVHLETKRRSYWVRRR